MAFIRASQIARVIWFAIFLTVAIPPASGQQIRHDDPWIVDTDMGRSDWLALMVALRHPRIDVAAISIVGTGIGYCPQATNAAQAIVTLATGGELPIACGLHYPLDGYHAPPPVWRDEARYSKFFSVPEAGPGTHAEGAVDLIIETLMTAARPLSVLAIGPLTNIGGALTKSPGISSKIREIVIMGGVLRGPGSVSQPGNPDFPQHTRAEWNIFLDPVAADIVFRSGIPIRLVSTEATAFVPVGPQLDNRLLADDTSKFAVWAGKIIASIQNQGFYYWDPLTAVVALDRNVCDYHMEPVSVGAAPGVKGWSYPGTAASFPSTNWLGETRRHLALDRAGVTSIDPTSGNWIMVCSRPNISAFVDRFQQAIKGETRSSQSTGAKQKAP